MHSTASNLTVRIERRLQPQQKELGAGLDVVQLAAEPNAFDPIVMIDH